jgi:hypothetical protein
MCTTKRSLYLLMNCPLQRVTCAFLSKCDNLKVTKKFGVQWDMCFKYWIKSKSLLSHQIQRIQASILRVGYKMIVKRIQLTFFYS